MAMDRSSRPMHRGRKKVCSFCVDRVEHIDYKDLPRLRKYVSERAKIIPRRVTGTCAFHQRELTVAIKRARYMALMPFFVYASRSANVQSPSGLAGSASSPRCGAPFCAGAAREKASPFRGGGRAKR